jgi:hypothetical protein
MQNSRIFKYGGIVIVLVAAAVVQFVFFPGSGQKSSGSSPDKAAPAVHTANGLAAGMIVRPIAGQFMGACRSPRLLKELLAHQRKHEKAEFEDMFNAEYTCAAIPGDEKFRILSVSDEMVEVVVSTSPATEGGMWAEAKTFTPAK